MNLQTEAPDQTGQTDFDDAAELLRALAHPLRLRLLLLLADAPSRVTDLVDAVDASQPLVSRHLRLLRDVGLVRGERRGREVLYSVSDDHVTHIVRDAVDHAGEES
jgi:DNA-binding transcriptional ArsR family regulator